VDDIFRYIDEHLDESLAGLTELCKLPTVIAGLLGGLGFAARVIEKPAPGYPVVYAEQPGRSLRTTRPGQAGRRAVSCQ